MDRNDLHDYQNYATNFIEQNDIAAVLLDMGLGKTAITLTALNDLLFDYFTSHKILIIAPLRVARETWPNEIKKWDHLKDLKYSVVVGTEKERMTALYQPADIYIINRENVCWLVENWKFDFDTVVVDELSSFKNGKAKRFKSLMKVRPKVKRIVGLTGTPAGNGLMDLWAEFKVLDMGKRLGRFISGYRDEYFLPDKRNGQVIFTYKPKDGAEELIYKRINDITISMKAQDHIKMPELVEVEYPVYLNDKERKKYKELKKELVLSLDGGEITIANAATLANKLSQMANGAVYDDDGKVLELHDRKLEALEDIIEFSNGKNLLVGYWFNHDLKRIEKKLDELGITYAKLDKTEDIERWNKGELQVGLIHPASAGHGLNLQEGGSNLVWYGLTWSLELYQQTIARLYRQGQKSETVVIQHIITKGTIDESILSALRNKDKTQSALIDAVKANI